MLTEVVSLESSGQCGGNSPIDLGHTISRVDDVHHCVPLVVRVLDAEFSASLPSSERGCVLKSFVMRIDVWAPIEIAGYGNGRVQKFWVGPAHQIPCERGERWIFTCIRFFRRTQHNVAVCSNTFPLRGASPLQGV